MRDIITASQAAIARINTAFTASQVAPEEVNTEADAFFERGGTATSTLRGGGGAPPSQPARQRPQSDRIRAAATAALSLTRGGRARGNESTVNIYGDYRVAYRGAYDPDAW